MKRLVVLVVEDHISEDMIATAAVVPVLHDFLKDINK